MTSHDHNSVCSPLLERLREGESLDASEHASLESCPECRAEERLHELLRDDGEPPLGRPDEVSEQRFIHQLLAREDCKRSQSTETGSRRPPRRAWVLAAVFLVLAGAALWLFQTQETSVSHVRQATEPTQQARVVLASDAAGYVPGQAVPEGTAIELAGSGQVALELHEAVVVWLDGAQAHLDIEHLSEETLELRLGAGRLFVHVNPLVPHPGLVIRTRSGDVVVTGTVFELRGREETFEVDVFRGAVEIRRGGAVNRRSKVQRGQRAQFALEGDLQHQPLTDESLERGMQRLRAIRYLVMQGVAFDLRTSPPGADIELDGVFIGKAPLQARVQAGTTLLKVGLEGYAPIREEIRLEPGEPITRQLLLAPVSRKSLGFRPALRVWSATRTGLSEFVRGLHFLASKASGLLSQKSPVKATPRIKEAPALSAEEQLKRAQTLRRKRDWKSAAQAYIELIDTYPDTPQGRTALISLGHLQLHKLHQTKAALASFEHYLLLGQRGALLEEARYGRIRALRLLGRPQKAKEAMQVFIVEHPNSILLSEVRQWLSEQ